MRIERLTCRNFRNLEVILQPGMGVNVIWGDNGEGKTNLLEGIYLFTHFKSFRGAANIDLLGPDGGEGRISLLSLRDNVRRELELTVTASGRDFALDGKSPRPLERLLEALRAVLFSPDELQLLRTQPAARRALLDRAIFQLDPPYLGQAVAYERILRQRNRLLRERASAGELQPWSESLAQAGAAIRRARQTFLQRFVPLFAETHRQLSKGEEDADLRYPGEPEADIGRMTESLRQELAQQAGREMRLKQTCAGPQRDDPAFFLKDLPVRHYASQGEWRAVVLSFKLALLRLLQTQIGASPVFLLDDMTAELDRERQGRLVSLLAESKAQVFITTTDPGLMQQLGYQDIAYFQMKGGRLCGPTLN